MNVTDELERLQRLHQSGALSDEEFAQAKSKLLNQRPVLPDLSAFGFQPPGTDVASLEQQTRLWGFALHLSILAGFAVPIAGLVVPVVIWQLKKDELPGIDQHGRNAVNWIISKLIYAAISAILVFAAIGIPMLIALGIMAVVFPIVAAIKAYNGEIWKYPLAIQFFLH